MAQAQAVPPFNSRFFAARSKRRDLIEIAIALWADPDCDLDAAALAATALVGRGSPRL